MHLLHADMFCLQDYSRALVLHTTAAIHGLMWGVNPATSNKSLREELVSESTRCSLFFVILNHF